MLLEFLNIKEKKFKYVMYLLEYSFTYLLITKK